MPFFDMRNATKVNELLENIRKLDRRQADADFAQTGLKVDSVIRVTRLAVVAFVVAMALLARMIPDGASDRARTGFAALTLLSLLLAVTLLGEMFFRGTSLVLFHPLSCAKRRPWLRTTRAPLATRKAGRSTRRCA